MGKRRITEEEDYRGGLKGRIKEEDKRGGGADGEEGHGQKVSCLIVETKTSFVVVCLLCCRSEPPCVCVCVFELRHCCCPGRVSSNQ